MSPSKNIGSRVLLALAVMAMAVAVWLGSAAQRSAVVSTFELARAAEGLEIAQLNQETGLRGFALTGREPFLAPYVAGARQFEASLAKARSLSEGDLDVEAKLNRQSALSRRWRELAEVAIRHVRGGGRAALPMVDERKRLMDNFRASNAELLRHLERDRRRQLAQADLVSMVIILVLGGLFGGTGLFFLRREAGEGEAPERAAPGGA